MKPEQEIRAKALEIKTNNLVKIMTACIAANRNFDGTGLWNDNDLEEFVEYITTGKKPGASP